MMKIMYRIVFILLICHHFADANKAENDPTQLYFSEQVVNKTLTDVEFKVNFEPVINLCCQSEKSNCVKTDLLLVPTPTGNEEIDLKGNIYQAKVHRPCKEMFPLDPENDEEDVWLFMVSFKGANINLVTL
jgi:hypothetical protein